MPDSDSGHCNDPSTRRRPNPFAMHRGWVDDRLGMTVYGSGWLLAEGASQERFMCPSRPRPRLRCPGLRGRIGPVGERAVLPSGQISGSVHSLGARAQCYPPGRSRARGPGLQGYMCWQPLKTGFLKRTRLDIDPSRCHRAAVALPSRCVGHLKVPCGPKALSASRPLHGLGRSSALRSWLRGQTSIVAARICPYGHVL
jgi:hypothetical protein